MSGFGFIIIWGPYHSEKTNNDPPIKSAYVTMTGDMKKSGDIQLSHSLEEIKSGDIGCLLGHSESFLSPKGKEIIQSLKQVIVLECVDEAHASLRSQWGHSEMREEMYLAPALLRAHLLSTTRAPILAMTASAKVDVRKMQLKKLKQCVL